MKLHVNFRRDLKRLSDSELEERLEATSCARSQARPHSDYRIVRRSLRGPVRHPAAYIVINALNRGPLDRGGDALIAIAALSVVSAKLSNWIRSIKGPLSADLLECELRDIHDEITRRLAASKGKRM
jgi:hypothetical protein